MEVRVRYAPSPTGLQHIGGIRTALFNYFFARSHGGKFILRIEDTDRERYSDESLDDLFSTLGWLGVEWDEGPLVGGPYGPYVQSERFALYQSYAKQLVESGKAYYCYCTPERLEKLREEQQAGKSKEQGYDRHCRNLTPSEREAYENQGIRPVIRLKVPLEGKTTFHDILMGDITRKNRDVNPDPVLLKSDGYPTYHLANVIDDHLMQITHIMRAQEWIPSGPLHVLLYEAFGWEPPKYCHLPMVMGKDGQKLSKRHGSTSVRDFRAEGYLPEALMNYVSLLGWSYDGQTEFFSKEDLERIFTLEKINKAPGIFDYKKLEWFNGQYIRKTDDAQLCDLLLPWLQEAGFIASPATGEQRNKVLNIVPAIKERLKVLSDVVPMTRFLFEDIAAPTTTELVAKNMDAASTYAVFEQAVEIVKAGLEAEVADEAIEEQLSGLAQSAGVKVNAVFMPIRVALTGSTVSPPLFDSIRLLGTEKTYARLDRAVEILKGEV